MRRQALTMVAAALCFGAASALAQSGDLSGVTMRVLDDLSGVDAVVLELDASRGEGEQGAEEQRRDSEARDDEDRDTATRDDAAEDARRELGAEGDDLHEADDDERSEGRLEDRDVERPAVPPAAAP
jgi:hypothetical protein